MTSSESRLGRNFMIATSLGGFLGLTAGEATAATIQYTNISAASFAGRAKSLHNDGLAPEACAIQVPLEPCEENRGDLQNAAGSFIASVNLPNGATVLSFTLYANDADADINSTAYLMRKAITNGLKPAKTAIVSMAIASTSGAVTDTLRAFTDSTIVSPVVANMHNQYFVELVNCGKTVEPFSVQIVTSTP